MIKHQLGFESDWECDAGSGWREEAVEVPTKEVKKMGGCGFSMANKLKILHDRHAWYEAGDYKIISLLVGYNIKTTMNICVSGTIYLNMLQSGCFCSVEGHLY